MLDARGLILWATQSPLLGHYSHKVGYVVHFAWWEFMFIRLLILCCPPQGRASVAILTHVGGLRRHPMLRPSGQRDGGSARRHRQQQQPGVSPPMPTAPDGVCPIGRLPSRRHCLLSSAARGRRRGPVSLLAQRRVPHGGPETHGAPEVCADACPAPRLATGL